MNSGVKDAAPPGKPKPDYSRQAEGSVTFLRSCFIKSDGVSSSAFGDQHPGSPGDMTGPAPPCRRSNSLVPFVRVHQCTPQFRWPGARVEVLNSTPPWYGALIRIQEKSRPISPGFAVRVFWWLKKCRPFKHEAELWPQGGAPWCAVRSNLRPSAGVVPC